MKVCFVSYEYPPNILGGAGSYAKVLTDGLKNYGINLSIITNKINEDKKNNIYGVNFLDIPYWRRFFFIKSAFKTIKKLNNIYDFDVIHFNEPHLIYAKQELSSVSTIHSNQINEFLLSLKSTHYSKKEFFDLFFKNTIGTACDFMTVHNTNKIICPSPHLVYLIKKYYSVDSNNIHYIPNGVDLKFIDDMKNIDDEIILNKYHLTSQEYLFYIGRLTHLKGVHNLIRVFKDIKKTNKKLKLVISGKGISEEELFLKNLASYSDDIIFTGYINSTVIKSILYKNAIALILPSFYEGLSMVILEAMSFGKPIIACEVGGNKLVVKHYKNGFLFKPGDNKQLYIYINKLIDNKNLTQKMGNYSRKLIENYFSSNIMVENTIKLYNTII